MSNHRSFMLRSTRRHRVFMYCKYVAETQKCRYGCTPVAWSAGYDMPVPYCAACCSVSSNTHLRQLNALVNGRVERCRLQPPQRGIVKPATQRHSVQQELQRQLPQDWPDALHDRQRLENCQAAEQHDGTARSMLQGKLYGIIIGASSTSLSLVHNPHGLNPHPSTAPAPDTHLGG